MAAPNFNEPFDYAKVLSDRMKTRYGGYRNEEQDYLNRYGQFVKGQETLPHLYTRLGDELGLPQLRQNYGQLSTTMANMPSTYSKAMTGFDVTANQLGRVIGQKSAELAPALTAVGSSLNTAESELGRRIGFAQEERNWQEKPFNKEQQFLADRIARENTGYMQSDENELNALIKKIQWGYDLNEAELKRAHELAIKEAEYNNQYRLNQQTQSYAKPFSTDSSGDGWYWDNEKGNWIPVYD